MKALVCIVAIVAIVVVYVLAMKAVGTFLRHFNDHDPYS